MGRQRTLVVTAGMMLSLFLASMESTVVSTAMPTIVDQLGGFELYAWVFSAYMLTSTTTVPLYGKLSDIFGRRPIYMIALGLFLLGSLLCGIANSMPQLIAARVVQGLGAGGLLPLAFIIIGEIFSLEQRARIQGLFSGVWGISSVAGPLVGGFFVDNLNWHWIFLLNLPFGLLAGALVWFALREPPRSSTARPALDYAGALLLTASVVLLLLALDGLGNPQNWLLLGGALLLLVLLGWVEWRAADPVLPLALFRDRVFAVACAHGFLAGCALFGSVAYIPLFVQAVLGTSATQAGATLTPLLLGWVVSSIIGSRMLLNVGYRSVALSGMIILVLSTALLTWIGQSSGQLVLVVLVTLMGIGMGLSIPAFLIAVQSTVQRRNLGTATATVQFSRSIGGTIGIAIMGLALSMLLAANLAGSGIDPSSAVDSLIQAEGATSSVVGDQLRQALSDAMRGVFGIALIAALLGLIATALAPRGQIAQLAAQRQESLGATAD